MIGLDTGFFVQLLDRREQARRVWQSIQHDEVQAAVSCITCYELLKVALRGRLQLDHTEKLIERLPLTCRMAWLDARHASLLQRAARIAHGNGLAMADALILISLMEAGAETLYTTDADMKRYSAGPEVRMLSSSS